MQQPSNRSVRRGWRRTLFWLWIGGSILLAIYLAIAAPLVPYTDLKYQYVALVVPPVLALMVVGALGWLAMLVASKRGSGNDRAS